MARWIQPCTEPPSSEGAWRLWMAPKAFKLHANHETLWTHLSSSTTRSKGECVWYCDTEGTPSGAAPTSPPEGVFRHTRRLELDEQSGRTAGRLGCTGPATAYAIGGTAELALRYSIISSSTAKPIPSSLSVMTTGSRAVGVWAPPPQCSGHDCSLDSDYIDNTSRPQSPSLLVLSQIGLQCEPGT